MFHVVPLPSRVPLPLYPSTLYPCTLSLALHSAVISVSNFPQKGIFHQREREREEIHGLNVQIFSAGRVDCMKLLLSAGADVDSLDAKVDCYKVESRDSTLLISEGSDPVVRISRQPALRLRQTVTGGRGRPQWQPGQPLLPPVHHVSERFLSWSEAAGRVRGGHRGHHEDLVRHARPPHHLLRHLPPPPVLRLPPPDRSLPRPVTIREPRHTRVRLLSVWDDSHNHQVQVRGNTQRMENKVYFWLDDLHNI